MPQKTVVVGVRVPTWLKAYLDQGGRMHTLRILAYAMYMVDQYRPEGTPRNLQDYIGVTGDGALQMLIAIGQHQAKETIDQPSMLIEE